VHTLLGVYQMMESYLEWNHLLLNTCIGAIFFTASRYVISWRSEICDWSFVGEKALLGVIEWMILPSLATINSYCTCCSG